MARKTDDPTYERTAHTKGEAQNHVMNLRAFTGKTVRLMHCNHAGSAFGRRWWGEWIDHGTARARYVVYSYGTHWPLFIYVACRRVWLANSSTYYPHGSNRPSSGTRQHKSDLHPGVDCIPLPVDEMQRFVELPQLDFVKLRCGVRLDALSRAA